MEALKMKICFIKNMPLSIDLKGIRQTDLKEPSRKHRRSTRLCFVRPIRKRGFIQLENNAMDDLKAILINMSKVSHTLIREIETTASYLNQYGVNEIHGCVDNLDMNIARLTILLTRLKTERENQAT